MAYEFTKLADVPALEDVPEGANAFIEVDGEVRRVPGDGLGGGGGGMTTFYYKMDEITGLSIYAGIDDETRMSIDPFLAAAQQGPLNLYPYPNTGITTVYLNIDVQFSPGEISSVYSPGIDESLWFAESEIPEPPPFD